MPEISITIPELLSYDESEWLDFKREFHSNKAKFLHDILCLSNSFSPNDRYIVFGITDDKLPYTLENDTNKKTNANIQDFLRSAKLNRIPTTRLIFKQYQKCKVAILEIKNRPDKPFFTLQDYTDEGQTVRGGVIYSRIGDTNIPLKECSSDDQVELMWRERFGIGLDPLSRFAKLIEQKKDWIPMGEDRYMYHKTFPEFTISERGVHNDDFKESWANNFPDPHATSYWIEIKYLSTVLKKVVFVSCDGGRYFLPLPELDGKNGYYFDLDSIQSKIADLYEKFYRKTSLEKVFIGLGIKVIRSKDM